MLPDPANGKGTEQGDALRRPVRFVLERYVPPENSDGCFCLRTSAAVPARCARQGKTNGFYIDA